MCPIGTAAMLRDHQRLSHLVVLNTWLQQNEGLLETLATGALGSWFSDSLVNRVIAPAGVELSMQLGTTGWLWRSERKDYSAPYKKWFNPEGGCRATAGIQLFENINSDETEATLYTPIRETLQNGWHGPARIILGMDDFIVGPASEGGLTAHEGIVNLLPQAEVAEIKDAHHFMQEDKPYEIADEIRAFLETNPQ